MALEENVQDNLKGICQVVIEPSNDTFMDLILINFVLRQFNRQ